MNSISDYLKLVKAGIQNGDKIISALAVAAQVKNGRISAEALAEILRRKDICSSCPFNSKNVTDKSLLNPAVTFKEYCVHCLCRLGGNNSKEYCLKCTCGISEYNKKHPETPMELKWEPFIEK